MTATDADTIARLRAAVAERSHDAVFEVRRTTLVAVFALLDAQAVEVEGLRATESGLLKLARFGAAMLHWHRGNNPDEVGDVDAITCQEEAIRCGVLEGRNVDEPCCDQCVCAPFIGWEVCYFVPDDVRVARAALTKEAK